MKLEDGLVGIADTRVTTGSECITAQKLNHYESDGHAFFIMTSGLRSVRDKTLTYFNEAYSEAIMPWERLFHICNEFAERLRRVSEEDKKHLEENGLRFNTHAIIGGQMEKDDEPRLYLVYPEGNWVEIASGTPYPSLGTPATVNPCSTARFIMPTRSGMPSRSGACRSTRRESARWTSIFPSTRSSSPGTCARLSRTAS